MKKLPYVVAQSVFAACMLCTGAAIDANLVHRVPGFTFRYTSCGVANPQFEAQNVAFLDQDYLCPNRDACVTECQNNILGPGSYWDQAAPGSKQCNGAGCTTIECTRRTYIESDCIDYNGNIGATKPECP